MTRTVPAADGPQHGHRRNILEIGAARADAVTRRTRVLELSEPEQGHAFDAWRHWRADTGPLGILAADALAPSPHNTQP